MSCTLDEFNKGLNNWVVETTFQMISMDPLIKWRDRADPGTADAWGRRFAIALPIALMGIVGLIDSVASIAFGIITAPGELFGCQLSRNLLFRSVVGIAITGMSLTFLQYSNIVHDCLEKGTNRVAKEDLA